MGSSQTPDRLYQYAANYSFDDFECAFAALASTASRQELGEAYLMRAQIKLLAADESLVDDLGAAAGPGPSLYPCLGSHWPADSPNRFNVFPTAPGALSRFLAVLPQAAEELGRRFGEEGSNFARGIQNELLYFLGRFDEALTLATQQQNSGPGGCTGAILSQCVQFRCHLATGHSQEAEQCMLEMIRLSRAWPRCLAPYEAIRQWANLTTGWNGDTPRFHNSPGGAVQPVLEDLLNAIRQGFSRMTPLEAPFVAYAQKQYENAYTLRQYYMDLFNAMYWFQAGDMEQAEAYFLRISQIAAASGIFLPIVECGGHVLPLLRHIENSGAACPRGWLAMVQTLAAQYEKTIDAYRD